MPSSPLRRAVDLGVYAPVGLAVLACEHVPRLVDLGRERVEPRINVARFLGQMVVTQGRRELERRLRPEPVPAPVKAAPTARVVPRAEEPDVGAEPAVRAVAEAPTEPPPVDASTSDSLPIASYESLSAGQIVPLLGGLDADELELVRRFESAHRHRRTILGRIDRLVSAS